VHIAFRWQAREYAWRIAHDPAHRTMSPGRLLYACMIEAAFAEGCTEYHLGRGDEGYKADWNPHPVSLHRTDWLLGKWHRGLRRVAELLLRTRSASA
jgi:CelD/BcsL family acetyltransferase involved in cellulose biosynthesis